MTNDETLRISKSSDRKRCLLFRLHFSGVCHLIRIVSVGFEWKLAHAPVDAAENSGFLLQLPGQGAEAAVGDAARFF
jgi:hypothetical protein